MSSCAQIWNRYFTSSGKRKYGSEPKRSLYHSKHLSPQGFQIFGFITTRHRQIVLLCPMQYELDRVIASESANHIALIATLSQENRCARVQCTDL